MPPTTDELIRQQIERRLQTDPRTREAVIEVVAEAGRVTLRGVVESPVARAAAEQIAWSTPGVQAVANAIAVRPEGWWIEGGQPPVTSRSSGDA
jgi:osmotically-inducible protein OsmY